MGGGTRPTEHRGSPARSHTVAQSESLIDLADRRVALSTGWVFVMFNLVMADIIGFIEPGTLQRILDADITMIAVSRLFRRDINRMLHLVAVPLTLLYVLGGGNWEAASYPVFASLEVAAMSGIAWCAAAWPTVAESIPSPGPS